MEMIMDFLGQYFVTLFLIAGFSMQLAMRRQTRDAQINYLWVTVAVIAAMSVLDFLETIAAEDPELRFWRVALSVLGYSLRPIASLSITLVVAYRRKNKLILWLPAIVNCLLVCTAFFSPLVFSYDADYSFTRGPLGYIPFVVGFFYIFTALWFTMKSFGRGFRWEKRVLFLCGLCTAVASLLDAQYGGVRLHTAVMVSVVFYYMFMRTQDTHRDSLTRLLNRQAFYEDIDLYRAKITAMASLDMNGLKRLNDTQGHDAGDQALAGIGESLLAVSERNVLCYRMGGDEFLLLFLQKTEDSVRATLDAVQADLRERGISASAGYMMRGKGQDVQELYKLSDNRMYADKAAYYRSASHNRRR